MQASNAPAVARRRYHRGLSKAITNDSRYNANGKTHKNGMTATSWQRLLVTARSRPDAQHGSKTQSARSSAAPSVRNTEGGRCPPPNLGAMFARRKSQSPHRGQ